MESTENRPVLRIVALSGKMHSGKSTVANHLIDHHGFRRVSFASALKNDILRMGFSEADVLAKPDWMRALMQAYGQARRAVNPNHWVDIARNVMGEEYGKIVVDDLRFPNEYKMLRELGENPNIDVKILRITRLGYDRSKIPHAFDESETALDRVQDWDGIIQGVSGQVREIAQRAEFTLGLPHHG